MGSRLQLRRAATDGATEAFRAYEGAREPGRALSADETDAGAPEVLDMPDVTEIHGSEGEALEDARP